MRTGLTHTAAALSYYLSRAAPRWLRPALRNREVVRLFGEIAALPAYTRIETIEMVVAQSALRVAGSAVAAGIGVDTDRGQPELDLFILHRNGGQERVSISSAEGSKLSMARSTGRPVTAAGAEEMGQSLHQAAARLHSKIVDISPIPQRAGGGGFLVVFLPAGTVFHDRDLEHLQLIARYAAQVFDLRELLVRERSLSEELERAMVQADSASRAKTDFLANMSHELRTPLNSIIGFSEILSGLAFGPLNDKQKRHVENILGSGRHLLDLINDILDLSKIEAGRMALHHTEFDLHPAVAEVIDTVKPAAAGKNVTIEVEFADGLPQISADRGKFRQVMLNLVGNAVKFTEPGGRVTVRVKEAKAADVNEGRPSEIEIGVVDTGIGILPTELSRLFGKFEQLDTSYARSQEGTGLGLALTKRLAEMHGGRITAESQGEGRGSTFTVFLPIAPTRIPVAGPAIGGGDEAERHEPFDRELPLILVIEDDPRANDLITYYLDEAGFSHESTSNAEGAVALAAKLKPAAITLDILLPQTDGWEVLRRIKANSDTKGIPVFVISVTEERELGLSLGARDFFVKPISGRRLIESLREVVGENSAMGDARA